MHKLVAITLLALASLGAIAKENTPPLDKALSDHDQIMAKMDTLVFKKFEFKNATIERAVQLLTEESKKLDPNHKGVRFSVHSPQAYPHSAITLYQENASLRTILNNIQQQSNFVYIVTDTVISLRYEDGEGMTQSVFIVPKNFLEITPSQSPQSSYDVRSQLEAKGILLPAGCSAVYEPDKRRLTMVGDGHLMEEIDYLFFKARQS